VRALLSGGGALSRSCAAAAAGFAARSHCTAQRRRRRPTADWRRRATAEMKRTVPNGSEYVCEFAKVGEETDKPARRHRHTQHFASLRPSVCVCALENFNYWTQFPRSLS
jgi:hypothetical protein